MPDLRGSVDAATSWLFVPGDRPERFGKAVASGASVVILDLEDAVAEGRKIEARESVAAFLELNSDVCVRINAATTTWHEGDLAALAGQNRIVMVPKAEDPASLDRIAGVLGPEAVLVALVETASGVLNAQAVARHPAVGRLAFGSHDLAAELRVSPTSGSALLRARSELVLASAAAGLAPPVDGVTVAVRDAELLAQDVRAAVELGFAGKLCIHPAQVETVAGLFRPTPADVAWAERIIEASRSAAGGAVLVDGEMVDRPVLERAEQILRFDPGV